VRGLFGKDESRAAGTEPRFDPVCDFIQFRQNISQWDSAPGCYVLCTFLHGRAQVRLARRGRRVTIWLNVV
jgi:hypothetical protein